MQKKMNFVTLLYVYNEFINADVVKEKRFKQIQQFINGRAIKNKKYFDKNECIKNSIFFCKKSC